MLTLYYKPTCPYSRDVLEAAAALGVTIELKDISADPALREELIERGGKKQTPYLVDRTQHTAMYESRDIIAHLEKHYGDGTQRKFAGLRIHRTDEVCD